MPFRSSRTLALISVSSLLLVSACAARQTAIEPLLPPVADLRVESKPQLKPEDLQSEAALTAHDIALETWGERGWQQVARLCHWAQRNGLKDAQCPAEPAAQP
jgi:hypothetical protein